MASSMNDLNNEFASLAGTGRTVLEEAMTQPAGTAGLWVASEAHTGVELQEVIKDPPVANSGDYGMSHA
jgi:hypothetical protein